MHRLGFVTVMALCVTACGGDDAPTGATYDLSDGTTIDVGADGSVALSNDGHALMTFAAAGPESATFDLSWTTLFGMWRFLRDGEKRTRFDGYAGSEAIEDGARVRYESSDGGEALLDIVASSAGLHITLDTAADYQALSLPIECDAEASFHGWGAQYNATDQRGETFELFTQEQGLGRTGTPGTLSPAGHEHTSYYPMPYFMDARGYGMSVDTDHRTLVDLCATDPAVARIEVEASAPLEADVLLGPTPAKVIEQLGAKVGRPAQPPSWAYDLWIGSQGGREAVLAEVDALEAADIPVGVFWVQDWTGPRPNAGGGSGVQYRWVADEEHYPDLAGMISELNGRGYRFLSYVNPFIMPNLPDHFDDMAEAGLLIQDEDGEPLLHASPAGDASHPDLTNPKTRDYVKGFLSDMVSDLGMDGWMADFGEWMPPEAVLSDGSDAPGYHNRYPEAWHRLSREVMDDLRPDGDWVVFSRSGWTGQQSVAQVVWCGDQEASFEPGDGLPTVVPCMLNYGLSGVPFVTHEIAGFSGGPSTKELYLRWIELSAFSPIMRTHEGDNKDDNWSWVKDEETIAHLRRFAKIHQLLGPELEALASDAAKTSMPLVRHLMIEFPEDVDSRAINDQFMLGSELLVAPIVAEDATTREVYLPPGVWFHVWSGDEHQGGTTISVDAPVGSPPVFALGEDRDDLRSVM